MNDLILIKISERYFRILIDPAMFGSLFAGYYGCQFIFSTFFRKMSLLIPWCNILNFGKYPELKKINLVISYIIFFMPETAAGAHDLHAARFNSCAISHGINMIHLSLN